MYRRRRLQQEQPRLLRVQKINQFFLETGRQGVVYGGIQHLVVFCAEKRYTLPCGTQ